MKKYRQSQDVKYRKVSLKFSKQTLSLLEKATSKTEEKNLSATLEQIVSENPVKEKVLRRKRNSDLLKKNFTFTENFYQTLKKSGNMSLYVEQSLSAFFA